MKKIEKKKEKNIEIKGKEISNSKVNKNVENKLRFCLKINRDKQINNNYQIEEPNSK